MNYQKTIDFTQSVRWSTPEVKVAYFQETRLTRDVIQNDSDKTGNPTLSLEDWSVDWTEYQEDQTRHKAWKSHKGSYSIKRSYVDVRKIEILKRILPNRRSEHIQVNIDHKIQGQDVTVSTATYPCTWYWKKSFVLQEKIGHTKKLLINPNHEWRRSFHKKKHWLTSRSPTRTWTWSWVTICLRY